MKGLVRAIILAEVLISVSRIILLLYGDFTWDLKDFREIHGEYLGLLFVTSGQSLILFFDGWELCLPAFKPLDSFPQRIVNFSKSFI